MSRKLSVSVRFLLLLLFVLGFSQGSSPAHSAEQLPLSICTETARIMPLGDSITQGNASGVTDPALQTSYRKDLYNSLIAADYSVDFVGSLTNGQNVVPSFDPQHEGHAGWTDSQIAQNIYNNGGENWLGDLGANWPHIILLHIGTNVLNADPSDVETILNEIDEYETNSGNHITVILARITDWVPNNATLHTFNNNVQAMAEARTDDDIVMVDMEDGAGLIYQFQPAGDFFDDIHPYATGYTKMAAKWKTALDEVFLNCNTPPTITTKPGNQTNAENSTVSLDFDADDPDPGQTLSWSVENLPVDLSIDPGSGLISGTIDYAAAAGSPYSTTVTVHDSGNPSASDTYSFTWTVTNTNRAPTAMEDSYNAIEDDDFNEPAPGVLLNDTDPDGDLTLTAELVSGPSHGNLVLYGNGEFTYSPDSNYYGTDSFTYKAFDGTAYSEVVTVTINIAAVDDPTIAEGQPVTTKEDTQVIITLTAIEVDGDDLTLIVVDQPENGSLSTITWPTLTYTPDANYNGADSFTFKVNDGISDSNIATVDLTVNAVNDAPSVTNPGDQENTEGDPITLKIVADDIDGDKPSFSIAGQPPDLHIDPDTGIISGVLAYGSAADSPYSVTVTVSDGHATSEVVFTWTIQAAPRLYLPMITVFR